MLAARSAAGLTFTEAHGAVYDDDEDYSPEEDGDSANGDDPSEELVYWV